MKRVDASRGFAAVADGALYYECLGRRPEVVLLHGGSVDGRMFDGFFEQLGASYPVVRYDRRDIGRSTAAIAPYSETDDLAAVIASVRAERVVLVGVSDGGRYALDYAIQYPDRVRGLVVAGSFARIPPGDEEFEDAIRELDALLGPRDEASRRGNFAAAARLDLEVWAQAHGEEERRALATLMLERPSFFVRRQSFAEPIQARLEAGLTSIAAPALVVVGGRDVTAAQIAAARLASDLPHARLEVIAEADHFINRSAPNEFYALVTSFIQQLPR